MYKVTNTKKFIADYYEERDIRLGKQFYFIPGECAFDEASASVMSYLTEIYEIQETLGKTYYSNLFSRQEMVLSQNMLVKLLHLAKGLDCQLNLFGKEMGTAQIVEGRPELSLDMQMEGDELRLAQEGGSLCMRCPRTVLFYIIKTIFICRRGTISVTCFRFIPVCSVSGTAD
ncbi:hypothetical protein DXB96_06660 [Clostridium sp. OM07-10AC]|nr:hypothetical protein DXB96_06660 [Clostridium sp. OM07-10AC]